MNRCVDRYVDGWMDGLINGWIDDGRMGEWTDECMDG
jgi:hypothetical protein